MRRGLFALALVAVLGGALLTVSGGAWTAARDTPAAFRLADGSAGCAYLDGRLACRTSTMRTAAVLDEDGSAVAADVAVSWDDETTVLRPTESWWDGEFTCRMADGDLVCTSRSGGMIAVGNGRLIGSPPPAFATVP